MLMTRIIIEKFPKNKKKEVNDKPRETKGKIKLEL